MEQQKEEPKKEQTIINSFPNVNQILLCVI